jgi:hypothetical protein
MMRGQRAASEVAPVPRPETQALKDGHREEPGDERPLSEGSGNSSHSAVHSFDKVRLQMQLEIGHSLRASDVSNSCGM